MAPCIASVIRRWQPETRCRTPSTLSLGIDIANIGHRTYLTPPAAGEAILVRHESDGCGLAIRFGIEQPPHKDFPGPQRPVRGGRSFQPSAVL